MKKDYIVVIDSGIGGLSTLAECAIKNKHNYIYVADNKHCPYGSCSAQKIQSHLAEIIDFLMQKISFKIVLLACNTATTSSINFLRKKYPNISFVGTEPAICLASKQNFQRILMISTPATAREKRVKELAHQSNSSIKILAIETLAKDIEDYYFCKSYFCYAKLLKSIMPVLQKSKDVDCIVLGCTHYVFIRQILQKFSQKPLIDGSIGVSNQLHKTAIFRGLKTLNFSKVTFLNTLKNSSSNQNNKKILAKYLQTNNFCAKIVLSNIAKELIIYANY